MIRAGTPADLPEITDLRTSVVENHMNMEEMAALGITHATTTAAMLSGDLGCWVAEVDARIVAFAMADRRDGDLFALFTRPGFEKRGFGSRLLTCCEVWLKEHGVGEAKLWTARESYAAKFYLKKGWEISRETPADPRDVYLRKSL